jgi:phosphoglycerol transferase MdoB-like AlkP superfamily enzyme
MLEFIPKKVFAYAALVVYGVAVANAEHTGFFVFGMAASAVAGYLAMTPEERKDKAQRKTMFIVAAFCYIPAVFAAFYAYQKEGVQRQFESYLATHNCNYVDTVMTDYVPEQCDKFGVCSEGHEVLEDQYFCRSTRRKITFKQFAAGNYGSSLQ